MGPYSIYLRRCRTALPLTPLRDGNSARIPHTRSRQVNDIKLSSQPNVSPDYHKGVHPSPA